MATIPRVATQAYYEQMKRQRDEAREYVSAALLALSGQNLPVASLRDRAIALITYAVNRWGERAAAASVDFFDETMEASGIDVRASMPSGIFSADEISRIGHYQAGKLTEDNYQGFVDQIAQSAGFLVYQAGPRTMFYQGGRGVNGNTLDVGGLGQEAYLDPSLSGGDDYQVRYQRIPQGLETCDFCLMLASRGAVYLSEESAGGDDPDHFHRGCDCLIVPALCHYDYGKLVQDTQFEGYDTKAMYDLWQEWTDVSASGLSREEQTARKLDLMERRIGRRDWTYD